MPKSKNDKPADKAPTKNPRGGSCSSKKRSEAARPPRRKPYVRAHAGKGSRDKRPVSQAPEGPASPTSRRDARLHDGRGQDNLRARAEGSEASAFGMHQADAGSDAYDRDFALSLLSQEQDALYEIEEALKRIDWRPMASAKCAANPSATRGSRPSPSPVSRWSASPRSRNRAKSPAPGSPVTSLFGLTDEEAAGKRRRRTGQRNQGII